MMQRPRDVAQIVQKRSPHAANIRCYHEIAKYSSEKLQSREAAMQWGISPIAALASGGARAMSWRSHGGARGGAGGSSWRLRSERRAKRCVNTACGAESEVPTGAGRRGRQPPTSLAWLFTFVKYTRKSLILFDFGKIHVFCGDVLLNVARLQGSDIGYYKCKAGLYKCKAGILQM